MIEPVKVALNYDERTAIITLRKAMRSPERATHIIQALLKDQSKELAYHALKQVGKEMNDLLEINRAFSNAAHIATANPATVIARWDEVERLREVLQHMLSSDRISSGERGLINQVLNGAKQ